MPIMSTMSTAQHLQYQHSAGQNILDSTKIRNCFPILAARPETIFMDTANTTPVPASVIDCINQFHKQDFANAGGRGAYTLARQATLRVEQARACVAEFIGCTPEEIAFTSGATDSLNTVALAWGVPNLKSGDEIMLCPQDHPSCTLPWYNLQTLFARFGVNISIVPFRMDPDGDYDLESIDSSLSAHTRVLSMTHVHHIHGRDMELGRVREIVGQDVLISLDANASVGRRALDFKTLGVEFLSFSGHKMFAGTGVGVLAIAQQVQDQMAAIISGGTTPATSGGSSLASTPLSAQAIVESGSPNVTGIISLAQAVDFIQGIGIELIERRLGLLGQYLQDALQPLPGLEFAQGCGCRQDKGGGYGILSFRFQGQASNDIAAFLDANDIQVRANHCGLQANDNPFLRVSLHIHNIESEIDYLVAVLGNNI